MLNWPGATLSPGGALPAVTHIRTSLNAVSQDTVVYTAKTIREYDEIMERLSDAGFDPQPLEEPLDDGGHKNFGQLAYPVRIAVPKRQLLKAIKHFERTQAGSDDRVQSAQRDLFCWIGFGLFLYVVLTAIGYLVLGLNENTFSMPAIIVVAILGVIRFRRYLHDSQGRNSQSPQP